MWINKQVQGQRAQAHLIQPYFFLLSSRRHFMINLWQNHHLRSFLLPLLVSLLLPQQTYSIHCFSLTCYSILLAIIVFICLIVIYLPGNFPRTQLLCWVGLLSPCLIVHRPLDLFKLCQVKISCWDFMS